MRVEVCWSPTYLLAHKNRVRSLAQDLSLFIVHDHDRGADVCQPIADFLGRPATTLALVVDGHKLLPCEGARVKRTSVQKGLGARCEHLHSSATNRLDHLQWPTPTNTWWAYQCLEVGFHTPLSPPPSSATRSSAYLRYTVFKEAPLPLGSGLPPLRYQKGGNVSDFQPAPSSASR